MVTMVTMAERIAKVEEQTKGISRIEEKLDTFIKRADCIYATKTEVTLRFENINLKNEQQDNDITWTKAKIWELFYRVVVIGSMLAFALKEYGFLN